MGLFGFLIASVVHLFVVGLDVTAFFLVVHVAAKRWSWPILEAFNRIGMPLTSLANDSFARFLSRVALRNGVARTVTLVVLITVFTVLRVLLVALGHWLLGVRVASGL